MKLTFDIHNKPVIESPLGKMTYEELLDNLILKSGKAKNKVQAEAGLQHPQLYKDISLLSVLKSLEVLGYEIIIRKATP